MTNTEIWRQRVKEWRASGLTATQFCAPVGLNPSSLYQWASRLGREATSRADAEERDDRVGSRDSTRLLRVIREPNAPRSKKASIKVQVDGATILVPAGFDVDTLRTVLAVLEGRRGGER